MGKVIALPRIRIVAPARRSKHTVRVRILDEYHPEFTRWKMQFHVQNAGGYRANKGFTDANARRHRWHVFDVAPHNIARFARQSMPLVAKGLTEVRIDGKALRPGVRRRA